MMAMMSSASATIIIFSLVFWLLGVLHTCRAAYFQFYQDFELANIDLLSAASEALFVFNSKTFISSARLAPDCFDIAFSFTNCSSPSNCTRDPIPFWLESGCGTELTSVWLSLEPFLSTDSIRHIRFHYHLLDDFSTMTHPGDLSPESYRVALTHTEGGTFFLIRETPISESELLHLGGVGFGWDIVLPQLLPSLFLTIDPGIVITPGYINLGTSFGDAVFRDTAHVHDEFVIDFDFSEPNGTQEVVISSLVNSGVDQCKIGNDSHSHGSGPVPTTQMPLFATSQFPSWGIGLYYSSNPVFPLIPPDSLVMFRKKHLAKQYKTEKYVPWSYAGPDIPGLFVVSMDVSRWGYPQTFGGNWHPFHQHGPFGTADIWVDASVGGVMDTIAFEPDVPGITDHYCVCNLTADSDSGLHNLVGLASEGNYIDGHSKFVRGRETNAPSPEFPPSIDVTLRRTPSDSTTTTIGLSPYAPGIVVLSDFVPPLGWNQLPTSDNRFIRYVDEDSIDPGGFSGVDTHSHRIVDEKSNEKFNVQCLANGSGSVFSRRRSHRHVFELNVTSSSPNNVPSSFGFLAVERRDPQVIVSAASEEMGSYLCHGIFSDDFGTVCGGRGTCDDQDTCNCFAKEGGRVGLYGLHCAEEISSVGEYADESVVKIAYGFSVLLFETYSHIWTFEQSNGLEFDCQLIVSEKSRNFTDSESGTGCEWIVSSKSTRVTHLLVRTTVQLDEILVLSMTDSSHEIVVSILPEKSQFPVVAVVVPVVVVIIVLIGLVVAVVIITIFFVSRKRRQIQKSRDRIDEIMTLEDIDLLLEERTAQAVNESEPSVSFHIDKSLFELEFSDIRLEQRIGKGGSAAVVYKATWKNQTMAFKLFTWMSMNSEESRKDFLHFEKEVKIMRSVSHPALLRCYGACVQIPRVGILMEFCENGDLKAFLDERPGYPLVERIRLLSEIAAGLLYLHEISVIHRDLKPENVLITSQESARIMDFGISKIVKTTLQAQKMTKRIGTSSFMAPEVTLGERYTSSADVFSFGILVYTVVTGDHDPYGKISCVELKVAQSPTFRPDFAKKSLSYTVDSDSCVLKKLRSLAKACWAHSASERPSTAEICRRLHGGDGDEDEESLRKFEKKEEIEEEEEEEDWEEEEKEEDADDETEETAGGEEEEEQGENGPVREMIQRFLELRSQLVEAYPSGDE